MDRRDFIGAALKGIGLFTILPAATTYNRIWKPRKSDKLYIATYDFSKANPGRWIEVFMDIDSYRKSTLFGDPHWKFQEYA